MLNAGIAILGSVALSEGAGTGVAAALNVVSEGAAGAAGGCGRMATGGATALVSMRAAAIAD
jgi:hypothetical protein